MRDAITARLQMVERERTAATGEQRAAALLHAATACRAAMREGGASADHAALYGADGLPT